MEQNEKIDESLAGLCGRKTPFQVPSTYFEELSSRISGQIALDQFKSASAGHRVPENYFDTLHAEVSDRISLEALAGKQTPFTVPDTYFEHLESRIAARIAAPEVVPAARPVIRRMFGRSSWKYASAACIVMAFGAALLLYSPSTNFNVQSELSSVPENDIEQYLQENTGNTDLRMLMENMDHDMAVKPVSQQIDKSVLKDYIETQL